MATLDGPRRAAASGETKSLVIFLHGYGADGADLIGLAEPLEGLLPDTAFVAPNAPERNAVNPMGYQWFPIPRLDGSSAEEMQAGFARSEALLETWLAETIAEHGVAAASTAVVGFSQGTMMALAVVPRRTEPVACIVGFSGRVLDPDALRAARSKPPVLLVHGDQDPMVPFQSMAEAETALAGAGFAVRTHRSRGVGHGIAPDGLGVAAGFLQAHLGARGG